MQKKKSNHQENNTNHPSSALRLFFQPIQNRNFLLLSIGQGFSQLGDWAVSSAITLWIYELTGSALQASVIVISQHLPRFIFGLGGGWLADRVERIKLMIYLDLLRAILIIALLLVSSREQLWVVFTVAFIEDIISSAFLPAKNAVLPNLVDESELATANALSSTLEIAMRGVGPSVGMLLFSVLGIPIVVAIDSLSFLISAFSLFAITRKVSITYEARVEAGVNSLTIQTYLEGFKVVFSKPFLAWIFIFQNTRVFLHGSVNLLLIIFVDQVLSMDLVGVPLLLSLYGLGMFLGSIFYGIYGLRFRPSRVVQVILVVDAILLFIHSFLENIPGLIIIWFISGCLIVPYLNTVRLAFQASVPDASRGRVFGVYEATTSGMMILSVLALGVLADLISVKIILLIYSLSLGGAFLLSCYVFGRPSVISGEKIVTHFLSVEDTISTRVL